MIIYSSVELKRIRFPLPFRYTSLQLFIYRTRVMVVFLLLALTFRSLRASIIVVGLIVGPSSNCTYCRARNYAEASTGSRHGRSFNARPARRALPLNADDAAHFISTAAYHTMPCTRLDSKGPPSLHRWQAGRHQHRLIASSTACSALSPPAHAQPIVACAASFCSAVISSSAEFSGLHKAMSS